MCNSNLTSSLVDHEVNIQGLDHAIPATLANLIIDAGMLAVGYSICVAYSNAAAIAAVTCALGPVDAGDKSAEKRSGLVESPCATSVEDRLASDRRSIKCKTLGGGFENDLTMSLRKDLILASSVVR